MYQKLKRFPLGKVKAEGFLKQQLEIAKDGMSGHLYKLEPEMIAAPYVKKVPVPAWGTNQQSGWGAEISGNYWTGYIEHAFTLGDDEMIKIATQWVDAMLKNQKDDGYLGTYFEEDANIYEDFNAWGTSCVMRGLIAFYEATGRKDVLDAVYRCMLWFIDKWAGDNKTCYAGVFIVEPLVFVYSHIKDKRLIDFAEEYMEYMCENDPFRVSYKTMLSGEYHYKSQHTAGEGLHLRLPALMYSATGKEDYLKASEIRIQKLREKSVQLTGGPVSVSEYLGPVGAVNESEYCSFAFYNATYSYMSYITGEAKYGDYMEEMFYNAAQGARKKDEKALAYLSAPNQVYATDTSATSAGEFQVYSPCYHISCCAVNGVAVIPEFVRGMLLCDDEDNVYAMAYGPCSVDYNGVSLEEKTLYPFRNNVSFDIKSDKEFALNLKIPSWAKGYKVFVNGEETNIKEENNFVTLKRTWKKGDTAEIKFDAQVEVIKVDDSDASAKYPLAVKYGALLYAYHIPENWIPTTGRKNKELPEGWSWYNVKPDFTEPKDRCVQERFGYRKNYFTWNFAIDENLKHQDFIIEECDTEGYPWETPFIKLHTHCYKAPYLNAPYEARTFEPFVEYQYVTDKMDLTLEPFGCTNLRISYFPKAKLD